MHAVRNRTRPDSWKHTGKASEVYKKCLEEVQAISCATLFSPVTRHEAVQAMSKHSALA